MKVGFAVQSDEGMECRVYNHFSSASAFVIVDTEGRDALSVDNKELHHAYGACNPMMALAGRKSI